MKNRVFIQAIVVAITALSLAGCLSDGRVSGHNFWVHVDGGLGTPNHAVVFHDLDVLARRYGFVPYPRIGPPHPGKPVFAYILSNSSRPDIALGASYSPHSKLIWVILGGPAGKPYQQVVDSFYHDFHREFTAHYADTAITDAFDSHDPSRQR